MSLPSARLGRPSFAELYTPKLVTVCREDYGAADLRADALAGLTVAVVALPLSMAIAIASGVPPERGLIAAIVGGFVVSALGGSRFQIGGPAGAFIVLVAATVAQHGIDGLILATFLSGLILAAIGLLRLGTFVKYVPYPVTVGFTAGVSVIILASQIRDFLGLTLPGAEPGPLLPKLVALFEALPTASAPSVAVALVAIGVILAIRRLQPHWPGLLIAVATASAVAAALDLQVDTIGSRFGGIPDTLPAPRMPDLSPSRVVEMLPSAISFALLGAIESLLSAVVADSMSGARHRSNCELVAQGAANVASALFGGVCVTGTIARTATNVRAGARGPIAGMLHACVLLSFVLFAAPVASYVPLPALAGVLVIVAWNMAERREFVALLRASWGDALVLLVTFLLVIFRDLTEGIVVGFALGALLFLHRMAQAIEVQTGTPLVTPDESDGPEVESATVNGGGTQPSEAVIRISGAFFFASVGEVAAALDRIGDSPDSIVIDLSAVPFLDSTAAKSLTDFVKRTVRRGANVTVRGARLEVAHMLEAYGLDPTATLLDPNFSGKPTPNSAHC